MQARKTSACPANITRSPRTPHSLWGVVIQKHIVFGIRVSTHKPFLGATTDPGFNLLHEWATAEDSKLLHGASDGQGPPHVAFCHVDIVRIGQCPPERVLLQELGYWGTWVQQMQGSPQGASRVNFALILTLCGPRFCHRGFSVDFWS